MTDFYDRSQFGYNTNNLRTGAREIKNRIGEGYNDFTSTMGKRYEAYQNEQSLAAGNNPLSHVGIVPAAASTYVGVKALDAVNSRQLRLETDAGFKRQLAEMGEVDPARQKHLMKLRDEIFKPGVDPHLHAVTLQNFDAKDVELVKSVKQNAEAVKTLGEKMRGSGGRGLKFLQSLNPTEQKILEGYVHGVAKGAPTAEGFAQHVQKLQQSGKVAPDKLRAFGSVATKLSTENPAHIFDTVKTLGAYGGQTGQPASQAVKRGLELTKQLNMQHKPSIWSKLMHGAARLFKRGSITDEMVKQALEARAQPIFGHATSNALDRMIKNTPTTNMPAHARETKRLNDAALANFAKKVDEFEVKHGKLNYDDPDSHDKLSDFLGTTARNQNQIDYMDRRYGVKELGTGPNNARMTDEQIAQYQAAAGKKGIKDHVDTLSWNPTYGAFTTDMSNRSRTGVGFDPKTGGIMELTPLEIANKKFLRDRPQATVGRDATLEDAFKPREMYRDVTRTAKRMGQGALAGWKAGGSNPIIGPWTALVGAGAGGILSGAENAADASRYTLDSPAKKRKGVPILSTVADAASWYAPVGAIAGEAGQTAANLGERAIFGDNDTSQDSALEQGYRFAKPHVVRAFGTPRNEAAR